MSADEIQRAFLEEARAHQAVLADEAQPRATRAQAAQALKLAAGLVGNGAIRAAAEELETAFKKRQGTTPAETVAYLSLLLDRAGAPPAPPSPAPGFDAAETELLHGMFRNEAHEALEQITQALLALEKDRSRRQLLDEVFRTTHTMKGSAATVGLGAVSTAAHLLEDVLAQLRPGRQPISDVTCDALLAALDTLRAIVEVAAQPEAAELVERFRMQLSAAALAVGMPATASPPPTLPPPPDEPTLLLRRTRERHHTQPIVFRPEGVETEDRPLPRDDGERRREDPHVLRVATARVDKLMDGAGELVFDRTRIERRVQELRGIVRDLAKVRGGLRGLVGHARGAPELLAKIVEVEEDFAANVAELSRSATALVEDTDALRRTTAMLQEGLTQVRMTSVKGLFQRLARPLRDFERAEGKRVELVTAGEDTELDRAVVEKITDPLIHLLRNAVAHGIEPSEHRLERGKTALGRITLSARHQGDSVFVEVADDGAGVDPEKVRASLVAAARMTPEEARAATDQRIVAAIFEPGVSTRESADELAGRGIGLDVVRDTIARLGGEITVASIPGEGSRFSIRLPLTTAISQAFLFKVGGQVYALPNVHVATSALVELAVEHAPSTVTLDGTEVPLILLHSLLGAPLPADARRLPAVVVEFAGRRLAATCDKVIGAREIVVKSLGALLAPLGLFAGGTISGSGKVQIILDPAALVSLAYPSPGAVRAATAIPEARSGPITHSGGAARQSGRARILVADDSRSQREAVSRMLAADGHIVDLAADGWDAWEMMHEVRYDVLVTDLEMPRLGGEKLVEKVRQSGDFPELRVVVISSRAAAAQRERAIAVGADLFLAKPVTHQALAPQVSELLARKPS